MDDQRFIVEITPDSVKLMAALTHAVLLKFPDHESARDLLQTLMVQTDVVKSDPAEHGVGVLTYRNKLTMDQKKLTTGDIANGMDYSFLSQGMIEGSYQ